VISGRSDMFETKADMVYARLKTMIYEGEVSAGERLRLGQLAKRLRVSEMPIREALRMLQRDGLVEFESHRGAAVANVTWERVYEAVFVRMHLEVLAVREATPWHSEASVRDAQETIDRMDELVRDRRYEDFSEANRELHRHLWAPCPIELLKEEIEALWDRMWLVRPRSLFRLRPERAADAQREHRHVLEALRTGDAEAVGAQMEHHRANTLVVWQDIVRTSESEREVLLPTWRR
jgi:DNA-binding GntR family transcriptional regulator